MLLSIQSYAPFVSEACSTRRGRPLCLPAIFTHFVRFCSGRPFATLLSEGLGEVVCPYMRVCPGRIGVVREADGELSQGGLRAVSRGGFKGGFEGGLPETGGVWGDF